MSIFDIFKKKGRNSRKLSLNSNIDKPPRKKIKRVKQKHRKKIDGESKKKNEKNEKKSVLKKAKSLHKNLKKENNVKKSALKDKFFKLKLDEKAVFNSERQIEDYYRKEKEKAKNLLVQIEKEKAGSIIDISKKQLEEIKTRKNSIDLAHKELNLHLKKIYSKIREINSIKVRNEKNIKLVKNLEKSLRALEKEAGGIISIRKSLLEKENRLVKRMNELVLGSKDKLKISDEEDSEKLVLLEKEKENLIKESKDLLKEEGSKMRIDNYILDNISKNAQIQIKNLNKELREAKKEKVEILKKRQVLEISEEIARERLKKSEEKIEELRKKYRKVLGLK